MTDEGACALEALEATHTATLELLQRLRAAKEREAVATTAPCSSSSSSSSQPKFAKLPKAAKPKTRRLLRGHSSRVTDLHWGESDTLVSCARDGLMHLWHAPSARIAHTWQTPGSWAMTCCLDGGVAAVGGLDNMVSLYLVPDEPDDGAHHHAAAGAGADHASAAAASSLGPAEDSAVSGSGGDRHYGSSHVRRPEPDVRRPDITLEGHGG
jgi:WD40 repeat protein